MDFTLTWFDIILIVGALLYALYLYGTWNYDRFKNTNVQYIKPVPLLGNSARFITGSENLVESVGRVYTSFPQNRFVGLIQMRTPDILLRDPDLIRQIGVKDFEHFSNHRPFTDNQMDPILGNNLFSLEDQKWRDMRSTLSPAFTGSKMRNMYYLVAECAQQTVEYLKKETKKGSRVLDMKDLFTRYANDVIATASFGVKVDSLDNPDNQFYKMGKLASDFSGFVGSLKLFGFQMMPKVMRLVGVKFINDECSAFFRELVHGTMQVREREGIVRPDMIQLLMQARQGTLQHDNTNTTLTQQQDGGFATVTESDVGKTQTTKRVWTDDELTGQALNFFLAGFQTTSTALCFTCYELAVNPDVQKRLQEEIDEFSEQLDNVLTPDYEGINRMKYLDMVVTEGLRMWPPAPFTDRVCTKPYVLEDFDGSQFQVRKGEDLIISSYHIHRDEKYYENPDKFDPERFSDENKKKIKPFTYLPFGVGPRNCIGSRFALMEVKAVLFNILRYFDIVPCEKTPIPLKLARGTQMEVEKGFWVTFKPRDLIY